MNLLDLQGEFFQLARGTDAAHHRDDMAFRTSGTWGKQLLPADLDQDLLLAQTRTSILGVRIRDDTMRSLIGEFKATCADSAISSTQDQSNHAISNMSLTFEALNQRVGELLRDRNGNEAIQETKKGY